MGWDLSSECSSQQWFWSLPQGGEWVSPRSLCRWKWNLSPYILEYSSFPVSVLLMGPGTRFISYSQCTNEETDGKDRVMKAGALTELLKTVFFIQLASEFWELLTWSFLHMCWHKPNYPYFFKMLGKWATTGLENFGLWWAVIFQTLLGKIISRVPWFWRPLLTSSP